MAPGSTGDFYNFGERPEADGPLGDSVTASIGFWHNKNGRALLEGLNGGPQSTRLGQWLAATFPQMYGPDAIYGGANDDTISLDLSNAANEQVDEVFRFLHKRNQKSAVRDGGTPKVDAQVMAAALAVYVSSETLIAPHYTGDGDTSANIEHVQSFGFTTSQDGIAYQTFDGLSVLTPQQAADLGITLDADGRATIIDLLLATNSLANSGLLYEVNGADAIDSPFETLLRKFANDLYTAINEDCDS